MSLGGGGSGLVAAPWYLGAGASATAASLLTGANALAGTMAFIAPHATPHASIGDACEQVSQSAVAPSAVAFIATDVGEGSAGVAPVSHVGTARDKAGAKTRTNSPRRRSDMVGTLHHRPMRGQSPNVEQVTGSLSRGSQKSPAGREGRGFP